MAGHYKPAIERFWAKVNKRGPDDCWPWLGQKDTKGYGVFAKPFKSGTYKAHRFSYELHAQTPIQNGLLVCHRCDNPACTNPRHLWLGTAADNARDRDSKGRQKAPAKFTDAQITYFLDELAKGKRLGRVAKENGIHRNTLANIRDGKVRIWKRLAADHGPTL